MKLTDVDALLVKYGAKELWPYAVMGKMDNAGKLPLPEGKSVSTMAAEVRQRIRQVVSKAPVPLVKITGSSSDMGGVRSQLRYITDRGEVLRDDQGREYVTPEDVKFFGDQFRYAGSPITKERGVRQAFHFALGMPEGVDHEKLQAAAVAFAQREFPDHKWAWAFHSHQSHPHVHLIVRAEGRHMKRLNPLKTDLHRWRESFAQELQARGIAADATPNVVRGSMRIAEPAWVFRARKQGKLRKEHPLKGRVRHSEQNMNRVLTAWAYIHAALVESPDAADRALAAEVKAFVRDTPMLGHVAGLEIKREQERQRQQAPRHEMEQEPGPGR